MLRGLLIGTALAAPVAVPAASPMTYDREVARLTEGVESLRERAAARPASWLERERLAGALIERGRVTGSFDDWAAAEAALDEAFAGAPEGAGPFLTRARLDFTLHRFDRVEASLVAEERRLLLDDPARAGILALRADVLLQQGRTAEAVAGFEAALALHEAPDCLARLALAERKAKNAVRAEALYREAQAKDHGAPAWARAWLHLQLGLLDLDAGRPDDALAHYADAEAELSGWWLVDEHMAQALAAVGRSEEAARLYAGVAERTGRPAPMNALAALERKFRDFDEAKRWTERAHRAEHEVAARFPEAAHGHSH
jgi:tetratricopeptide (TPR) repeat protein